MNDERIIIDCVDIPIFQRISRYGVSTITCRAGLWSGNYVSWARCRETVAYQGTSINPKHCRMIVERALQKIVPCTA